MGHLLRREWLIISRYRVAWFFLILFSGTLFVTQSVIRHSAIQFSQFGGSTNVNDTLDWAAIISWVLGWGAIFSFLFVVQMLSVEFEQQTLQQSLRMGTPRWKWVTSKLLLALIAACAAAAAVMGVAATFPSASAAPSTILISGLAVGLKYWGYAAMGLLWGLMIRKPLPAMMAFGFYASIVEPLIGYLLEQKTGINVGAYLPAQLLSQVVPSPFGTPDIQEQMRTLILCPFYILGIYGLAAVWLNQSELKG